jgi:hypothetical protein
MVPDAVPRGADENYDLQTILIREDRMRSRCGEGGH